MYLSFYGLKIKPFQNSTNPSFFWLGDMHKEALAIFKYGILKMPGFLVLTGDIGTGKTTFANVLTNNLGDKFMVVKVPDPGLDEIDFMNYVSDTLDLQKKFTSKDSFFIHFRQFLHESSLVGKKVLLVIDECQRLSSPLLEEIIKLANIEKDEKKALKVLLIGQNEFNDVVLKNNSSGLEKLISINYAIAPLSLHETGEFIKHRLKIAGAKKDIFSPDALTKIYQFSSGIPRRINMICDHSLLVGFANGTKIINGSLVRECAEQLRPHGFSEDGDSDLQGTLADEDFRNLNVRPSASWKKVAGKRLGKTFGILMLITLPVFLVIYFTDQMTYRELLNYFKSNGVQIINTFRGADRQDQHVSMQPDTEKASLPDRDQKDTGMQPEKTVSDQMSTDMAAENRLTDGNDTPDSEIFEEDATASGVQLSGKPGWQDELPDNAPIGEDIVDADPADSQIDLPTFSDQQNLSDVDGQSNAQDSSDTAGVLPLVTAPDQSEAEKIAEEIVPENTAAPADVPQAATAVTSVGDAPGSDAADESKKEDEGKKEDENNFPGQKESVVNRTIVEDTGPKTQGDLLESGVTPEKPAEIKETFDEVSEDVDPGAIIDWVIKKRAR